MQAYLDVGPQVSCYPEYREVMVQHLTRHKLGHWDRALRELTSKALAAIVHQDPAYFSSSVLGQLLDLCADPCIEVSGALAVLQTILVVIEARLRRQRPLSSWDICASIGITHLGPVGRTGVAGLMLGLSRRIHGCNAAMGTTCFLPIGHGSSGRYSGV